MSKTIIAIEDDPQIAELIGLLLSSDEVKTVHFANGKDGLQAVIEQKPDLVLLDIMIPGMTGWEVYDAIRAHEEVRNIPIMILSVTQQSFERRAAFAKSEIDFFMTKPFDVLQLRQKINHLLKIEAWTVSNKMPKPRPSQKQSHVQPIGKRLADAQEQINRKKNQSS